MHSNPHFSTILLQEEGLYQAEVVKQCRAAICCSHFIYGDKLKIMDDILLLSISITILWYFLQSDQYIILKINFLIFENGGLPF